MKLNPKDCRPCRPSQRIHPPLHYTGPPSPLFPMLKNFFTHTFCNRLKCFLRKSGYSKRTCSMIKEIWWSLRWRLVSKRPHVSNTNSCENNSFSPNEWRVDWLGCGWVFNKQFVAGATINSLRLPSRKERWLVVWSEREEIPGKRTSVYSSFSGNVPKMLPRTKLRDVKWNKRIIC